MVLISLELDDALASSFTLSGAGVDSPAHQGTINWFFEIDNAYTQYLALGEQVSVLYEISIEDDSQLSSAGFDSSSHSYADYLAYDEDWASIQQVLITIDGDNDIPSLQVSHGSSNSADLLETDSSLIAEGVFTVEDIDRSDVVSASVVSVDKSGSIAGIGVTDEQIRLMLSLLCINRPVLIRKLLTSCLARQFSETHLIILPTGSCDTHIYSAVTDSAGSSLTLM